MWPQPAGRPLLTPSRHSAQETPRLSISTQVILGVLIEYCDTSETVCRWHIGATATRLDNMLPDTAICCVLGSNRSCCTLFSPWGSPSQFRWRANVSFSTQCHGCLQLHAVVQWISRSVTNGSKQPITSFHEVNRCIT